MSELSELKAQREEILSELKEIEAEEAEGKSRILEAIKNQRWYFFRNNKYILMDKTTGLLWANLDYFDYKAGLIGNFANVSGITGWGYPTPEELAYIVLDTRFPFRTSPSERRIKDKDKHYWRISTEDRNKARGDFNLDSLSYDFNPSGYIIPCSLSLIANTTYAKDVSSDSKIYSEQERLKITLGLFVNNGLWPKFDDDEITELYGRLYLRKPELTAKLQELDSQIAPLMAVQVLSSEFDYTAMLAKYDIPAVSSSVIKYFQALQKWTDELMSLIESYEREKENTISQFNAITLTLSKKYTDSPDLSPEENTLLRQRLDAFRKRLSLGMNTVKTKILAVKTQADDLEDRIDSTDSITELAKIEREERAGFPLIAENTARIITNALRKIEFFESHREFVVNAVKILTDWTEDYRVLCTTHKASLRTLAEENRIGQEVWESWFRDWQALRLEVERKLQPMLERGMKGDVPVSEAGEKSVPEQVIAVLEEYKAAIDTFFLEERKGIYQKWAYAPNGELSDKLETEAELYKRTSKFQAALQRVIFNCTSPADRIFILNWADALLDIQIDEVLAFVVNNDLQSVSEEILDGFTKLKQKNYDEYLSDAKAYGEELARREKQYTSLVFMMRQDLQNQKGDNQ